MNQIVNYIWPEPSSSGHSTTLAPFSQGLLLPRVDQPIAWLAASGAVSGAALTLEAVTTLAGMSAGFIGSCSDGANGVYLLGTYGDISRIASDGTTSAIAIPTAVSGATFIGAALANNHPYFAGSDGTLVTVSGVTALQVSPGFGATVNSVSSDGTKLYATHAGAPTLEKYTFSSQVSGAVSGATIPMSYAGMVAGASFGVGVGGWNASTLAFASSSFSVNPNGFFAVSVAPSTNRITLLSGLEPDWALATFTGGTGAPTYAVWASSGQQILVTDATNNQVQVIGLVASSLVSQQLLPITGAGRIAVTPDGLTAFVVQPTQNTLTVLTNAVNIWSVAQTLSFTTPSSVTALSNSLIAVGVSGAVSWVTKTGNTWAVSTTTSGLGFTPLGVSVDVYSNIAAAGGAGTGHLAAVGVSGVVASATWSGNGSDVYVEQNQIAVADDANNLIRVFALSPGAGTLTQQATATAPAGCTFIGTSLPSVWLCGTSAIWQNVFTAPYTLVPQRLGAVSLYNGTTFTTQNFNVGHQPSAAVWDAFGSLWVATLQNDLWQFSPTGTLLSSNTLVPDSATPSGVLPSLGISALTWWQDDLWGASILNEALLQLLTGRASSTGSLVSINGVATPVINTTVKNPNAQATLNAGGGVTTNSSVSIGNSSSSTINGAGSVAGSATHRTSATVLVNGMWVITVSPYSTLLGKATIAANSGACVATATVIPAGNLYPDNATLNGSVSVPAIATILTRAAISSLHPVGNVAVQTTVLSGSISAPTNLAATNVMNTGFTLSWTGSSGAPPQTTALFIDDFLSENIAWAGWNPASMATPGNGTVAGPGGTWTVTAGEVVQLNGGNAGFTGGALGLWNVGGTIWHVNVSDGWFSWNGSGWDAGSAPVSKAWIDHYPFFNNEFHLPAVDEREYMCSAQAGYLSSTAFNPFSVTGSVLSIKAQSVTSSGDTNPDGQAWNGGNITSCHYINNGPAAGLYNFQYGYVEIYCQTPTGGPTNLSSPGLWPQFVLYPLSGIGPAEIDIFEILGGSPTVIRQTIHSTSGTTLYAPTANINTGFHKVGVDWQANFITFYVDGIQTGQIVTPSDLKQSMYINCGLAVAGSGSWTGTPLNAVLTDPGVFQIDYIAVWANYASAYPSTSSITYSIYQALHGQALTLVASGLTAPTYTFTNLGINTNYDTQVVAVVGSTSASSTVFQQATIAESVNNTALTTTAGSIIDTAGNAWTLTAGATVNENGAPAGFTAAVAEILYWNHTIYHVNSFSNWYYWSGLTWVATTNPVAESPQDSAVNNTSGIIADGTSATWTLTPATVTTLQATRNSVADPAISNIALVVYHNHTVYLENAAGSWFSYGGSVGNWVSVIGDPRGTNFADEFTSASWLTHATWQSGDPWSYCGTSFPGGVAQGNTWWANKVDTATAAGVYGQSGSLLNLSLIANPGGNGISQNWLGALINNQLAPGGLVQLFGYFEFSVAVQNTPGFLFQFDFEDLPATSSTLTVEIDVVIWTDAGGVGHVSFVQAITNIPIYTTTSVTIANQNVYGVNWQSDFITCYINGTQVAQIPNPGGDWLTKGCFCYFLTSDATYFGYGPAPNNANLPATAHIDYMRIYQTKPSVTHVWPGNATLVGVAAPHIDSSVLVNPIGKPGQPLSLAPVAQGSTSLTVSWLPPNTGSAIDHGGYQLQYQKVTGDTGYHNGPFVPIITAGSGSFTDSHGNAWSISAGGVVLGNNNVPDNTTSGVILMALVNGLVWQQNAALNWWFKTVPTDTWQPTNGTATSPITAGVTISGLVGATPYSIQVNAANSSGAGPYCTPIQSSTTTGAGSGAFTISGGNIMRNNAVFHPKGIAILDSMLSGGNNNFNPIGTITSSTVLGFFPNLSIVNIAVGADSGGYQTAQPTSVIYPFIDAMTAAGVVCVISDYQPGQPDVRSGTDLINSCKWLAKYAEHYANNSNLWFTTENEVGGDIGFSHQMTYNACRAAGAPRQPITAYVIGNTRTNNGNVYFQMNTSGTSGGGSGPSGTGTGIADGSCSWDYIGPSTVTSAAGNQGLIFMEAMKGFFLGGLSADYTKMTGVGWNIHIYPWPPEYVNLGNAGASQAQFDAQTRAFATGLQNISNSADGKMPVLMGEGGNGLSNAGPITDWGTNRHWQVTQSSFNAIGNGPGNLCGCAIWLWSWHDQVSFGGETGNCLTMVLDQGSGFQITDYGRQVNDNLP